MNENESLNYEGAGQVMTSTPGSSGAVMDSSISQTITYTVASDDVEPAKTDSSSYAQWINIAIVFLVFALIYLLYRYVNSLKWHLQELRMKLLEQDKIIAQQNKNISTLRFRLDKFVTNADPKPLIKVQDPTPKERPSFVQRSVSPTSNKPANPKPSIQPTIVVKYATLQAPDASGTLRFAERSMTEEATASKMFEVELDTTTGTGLYRINKAAMSFLMSDLQQLRDFVEPFTIKGNTAHSIIDDKPGKIHQVGKFWIVDELARIKIV